MRERECTERVKEEEGKQEAQFEAEDRLQELRKEILETIFGPVDWVNDRCGYLACPGEHLHTTPSANQDCVVYLDDNPQFFCFHQHCWPIIGKSTVILRKAVKGELPPDADLDDIQSIRVRVPKKIKQKRQAEQDLRQQAAEDHDQILKDYPWSMAELLESSPTPIGPVEEQVGQLLDLWEPDDLVWIGAWWQARPEDRHIYPVSSWRHFKNWPDDLLICPSVMASREGGRRNANVLQKLFCVIERDQADIDPEENRALSLPVFRWLHESGLRLRAVIDSGGKSLHGWFDYPGPEKAAWLANYLRGFPHYDVAGVNRPSQPCRLPGCVRKYVTTPQGPEPVWQRLLYLDLTR